MQARRQRRPRQTPTMMPVTECTSKESGGEEGRATQGQKDTVFINPGGEGLLQKMASLSLTLWGHPSLLFRFLFFLR